MLVFKPHLVGIIALFAGFLMVSIFTACPAEARDWLVPSQAPTVQAAIDSCVTGDVVVLSPGTYDDCTNPNDNNVLHIGVLISGVSMRGDTDNPADVILDAGTFGRCLEMRNLSGDVVIENLTLRRGKAINPLGSGGGVFVYNSTPTFRNCVFDSCGADYAGGGISVTSGGLTVEDCVFNACYTENIGAAIRVSSSETTISGTTIYGSTGVAVHYSVDAMSISNTIIAGGDSESFVQNSTTDPDPTLSCVNFHGNDVDYDEFILEMNGQDGNISLDPLFCDPESGDLTLYSVSPCSEDNAGVCGQIGALPIGCGGGAVTHLILANGSGDFPTIQAAINAAAQGDTIALADGTFTGDGNRDIDFLGKAITVKGLNGDPELVIIDCQGSAEDPHRGFYFHNDEAGFTVLRDVTITNGWVATSGAAILCESGPNIVNCIMSYGHADDGAGIFCDGGSPQIVGCIFKFNEGRERGGGAGFFGSEAVVTDGLFYGNWGSKGGAVFLPDSSSVTLEQCTLTGNFSSVDKACIGFDGISTITLTNSLITFNNRMAVRNYGVGMATILGSNVFENADGDYTDAISGNNNANGNISSDPIYCDAGASDFSLRGDSPSAPYNAPDGELMGALGVGCVAPELFQSVSELVPDYFNHSTGANWVDLNSDGHLDVVVLNPEGNNEVLLSDGIGGFTEWSSGLLANPGESLGAGFGDIDNDGDLDVYFDTHESLNLLGTNDNGSFSFLLSENLQFSGAAGRSSWADYNNDGSIDLYIVSPDTSGLLMSGDGEGVFTHADADPLSAVENSVASVWCDYNNDGYRDLYVIQNDAKNILFDNDESNMVEASSPIIEYQGACQSAAWGDYDNDGYLDLYLVNDGEANKLFRNKGSGSFEDVTNGALGDEGAGRSGIWGDWDNDGDLDLFLTNYGTADHLLRNDGDGNFYSVGGDVFAAEDSSTGCSFGDFDGDGALDLLVAVHGQPTRVLHNQSTAGNHYLKLDLTRFSGMAGAPGARVRIVTADSLVQVREVGSSVGYYSNDPMTVHFGLNDATVVDSLTVQWPGGAISNMNGIPADQHITIVEPDGGLSPVADDHLSGPLCTLLPCYPNPFNPATKIRYRTAKSGKVSVKVFNVAGRLVNTIVDEKLAAGWHDAIWRGKDHKDRNVATGVYFIRVEVVGMAESRRVTLIK